MIVPIYANEEHKQAVESYLSMSNDFIQDISTKAKYNSYLDVLDIILEYHNNYGEGNKEDNYWTWLMIIPINVTVMTNGFFAGIETNKNVSTIRAYKILLNEMLQDLVDKLENLETIND